MSGAGPSGETLTVLAEGTTDLPPGKIATLVTYLEMRAPPPPRPGPAIPGLGLGRVFDPDLDWYRRLYTRVGEDLLWFSRRKMPDAELAAILHDPRVEVYALIRGGEEIGILELDRRVAGDVELAFFGLVPEAVGSGAGRFLMNEALRLAWGTAPRRVFVHTCAFDHPAALDFYRRSGFAPYKLAVEIGADPRSIGVLPRTAAPQVPLVE